MVLSEHKEQDEMMFTKGHNLHAEYLMKNAGLDEAQAGIKIAGRNSITSTTQMTPPLWQKVKRN